jgi:hypothetical protein
MLQGTTRLSGGERGLSCTPRQVKLLLLGDMIIPHRNNRFKLLGKNMF